MEKVMRNLRNDAVMGPGQNVLRRFLNDSTPNSRLTPEVRGGSVSNLGSVSARGVSPVRNPDFRNPTEEPSRVFLEFSAEDKEGSGYPPHSHHRRGGETISYVDEETRPSDLHEAGVSDDENRSTELRGDSLCPPNSQFFPAHLLAQAQEVEAAFYARRSHQRGLESAEVPISSELHENTSDWNRIRRDYESAQFHRDEVTTAVPGDVGDGMGEGGVSSPAVVPDRFRAGRESLSVIRNITVRESKRPKARTHDHDYKRRSSISPSLRVMPAGRYSHDPPRGEGNFPHPSNFSSGITQEGVSMHGPDGKNGTSSPSRHDISNANISGVLHPGSLTNRSPRFGEQALEPDEFDINLTYEGNLHRHRVSQHMSVTQLVEEAAHLFQLIPGELVLMLFGLIPHTLIRGNRISDPPRVGPGSMVLIFRIAGGARMTGGNPAGQPHQSAPTDDANSQPSFSVNSLGSKILSTFKLPKFDGNARQWKTWDKTFVRYLSVHQLDFVLEESFLAILPLSTRDFGANKMVYYILEDAITPGSLAAKYLRQAAKWNGNEAYSKLHDGYVFSGPQTMALLLAELVNIRFKADESASGFCLRLREVFEDLEMVPGPSSIHMNDTQKIGYLLSGIRQEKTLQAVYVALQDKQVRGCVTFEEACEDLHHRCEAIRADDMLNTPVRGQMQKALISTHGKKQNKGKGADGAEVELALCLEKECLEMIKKYLPLCALHYHQCISVKSPEVVLKEHYGSAKFNSKTQKIDYPSTVPKDRFPLPVSARPRKGLMFLARSGTTDEKVVTTALPLDDPSVLIEGNRVLKPQEGTTQTPRDNVGDTALGVVPSVSPGATKAQSPPLVTEWGDGAPANLLPLHVDQDARLISGGAVGAPFSSAIPGEISSAVSERKMFACKTSTTTSIFYVDSGAGQCLSSCSNAFLTLEPCHIEVVGIAGSLPIFGIGTAVFALTLKGGTEILVRIHNCLYSFGEFNLLSVSQMRTIHRNLLDLSLHAPRIRLHSSVEDNGHNKKKFVDLPLEIEDGLYALAMEPISSDDSRYLSSQIFDITPPGDYTPLNQKMGGHDGGTKSTRQMWTTMVMTVSGKFLL